MIKSKSYATKDTLRSYLFFWSGQFFSILGSSIVNFAIIWWVTLETQSAVYLSIAAFFSALPFLISTPIAGVVADRWDRRHIIIVTDSSQAIITFLLILMFISGYMSIWVIIFTNALRAVFQAFHSPSVNGIIPVMIPKEYLSRVNGITRFLTGLIRIIAPIIAAALLMVWSIRDILWIDIITFFIALIPIIIITIPSINSNKDSDGTDAPSFLDDFKEGFKIIKETPGILVLASWSALINFLILPFLILLPYFVNIIHNGSEGDLAFVMASMQGGLMTGSLLCSIKKTWNNKVTMLLLSGFIMNAAFAIAAISPNGNFHIIAIGQFIYGFFLSIGLTMYYTILQLAVPPEKQGRLFSFDATLSNIISPLSIILAGPLSELIGIIPLLVIYAILGMLVNVFIRFFSNVTTIDYENLI